MNSTQISELKASKEWLLSVIKQAQNITLPTPLNYLQRRFNQLRCNKIFFEKNEISRPKAILFCLIKQKMSCYFALKSFFTKKPVSKAFSLWDSIIDPHITTEKFATWINSKQVVQLLPSETIFVKFSTAKKQDNIIFLRRPIYEAVSYLPLSFFDFIFLLKENIKFFFQFIYLSGFSTELWGDFAAAGLIKLYQKKGLKNFYRTNSEYNHQEFWCEQIDFQTVWYSINNPNFQYKDIDLGTMPEHPLYYFMYFGHSWTWNTTHAAWIQNFSQKNLCKIVGPILFYTSQQSNYDKQQRKTVIVFDVTPCEEDYIRTSVLRNAFNYYNENFCCKFLQDIVEICAQFDYAVKLKPKRNYGPIHSHKYLKLIENLKENYPQFITLPVTSNMFNEIAQADFVISIPTSSPFDVAKSLEKPSLYYDPSEKLDLATMQYRPEDYVQSKMALQERLKFVDNSH